MTNSKTVKIALVQMRCDGTAEENLARALRAVGEAAGNGARLVVLPELFRGPYFCQKPDDQAAFATAEPVPGPTTAALSAAAKKHRVVLVGGSVFEKGPDGKFYNTASVFDENGNLLGSYRKTHIPEDVLYH